MIYPTDWQVRIAQAICSINPNAEVFVDETTEKITWLNGTTEITMSDIKTKSLITVQKVDKLHRRNHPR